MSCGLFEKKGYPAPHVIDRASPGDLIIVLSAGDITYVADELAWAVQGDLCDGRSQTARPVGAVLENYVSNNRAHSAFNGRIFFGRVISLKSGGGRRVAQTSGQEVVFDRYHGLGHGKRSPLVRSYDLDVAFIALHGRLGGRRRHSGDPQRSASPTRVPVLKRNARPSTKCSRRTCPEIRYPGTGVYQFVPAGTAGTPGKNRKRRITPALFRRLILIRSSSSPAREGSSIGISLVRAGRIGGSLAKAWKYDDKVLIITISRGGN